MNDNTTSSVADSTVNDHDFSKSAANKPIEDSNFNKVGNAMHFSGNGEMLNITTASDMMDETDYCIAAWVSADVCDSPSDYNTVWSNAESDSGAYTANLIFQNDGGDKWRFRHRDSGDSFKEVQTLNGNSLHSWHYVVHEFTGTHIEPYIDKVDSGSTNAGSHKEFTTHWSIGGAWTSTGTRYWDGHIDEVWFMHTFVSEDYYEIAYDNMNEPENFVIFGAEEQLSISQITLILNDDLFTFQEELGNTSWANESGTVYETAEFNITYVTSQVDYIRINITDLHANITASNISVKFSADNSNWGTPTQLLTLSDGSNTIWLNQSEWNAQDYCHGTNPFPVNGADRSVFMRVKISIPAGIGAETYTNTGYTYDAGYYT
jgi:hypothetical protein